MLEGEPWIVTGASGRRTTSRSTLVTRDAAKRIDIETR
jgi:hypothetical protein